METFLGEKGAGYSIEVVLAAVILFTFSYGAIQVPEQKDWSDFQTDVSARDLSYTLKKTGDISQVLRNSNPEALVTIVDTVSDQDLRVSGYVENLPLAELRIGFHTMPDEIHVNYTEPLESGDPCDGDLDEISANSEYPVLKTNASQFLENKHGVRLYFGDTDARVPGGYNGVRDYDALWVDNGTRCVFTPSEGPYLTDEIFMWGNSTDSEPEINYEFKSFNNTKNSFILYRAEQASDIAEALERPVNGIRTDTSVDTFNFSYERGDNFNLLIFQENESLDRIDTYESKFNSLLGNSSTLFLMNLSENGVEKDVMQDIGFRWLDADLEGNPSSYESSFSAYTVSEEVETYFTGLGGEIDQVTLKPGGKVISSQGDTFTSRDDLLFARNTAYDSDSLDGVEIGAEIGIGGNCGDDTQATFDFPRGNHEVRILDLAVSGTCDSVYGVEIRKNGEWEGPYLENEFVRVNGTRYVPDIQDTSDARFEFAGSRKVELVNHRQTIEEGSGERVARISFEKNYSNDDLKMISSVIYWLGGDQVTFQGESQSTHVSTTLVGGLRNEVFLPYKAELRWSE